jgi:hypothetical protein
MWGMASDEHFRLALSQGAHLMSRAAYFEAHECFEAVWRESTGDTRLLFHGLVQLAASYEQLRLGRARASARTFQRALAKLTLADWADPTFVTTVRALHKRLGAHADGPRHIDVALVPADLPQPLRLRGP